jgi:hypothetical protein
VIKVIKPILVRTTVTVQHFVVQLLLTRQQITGLDLMCDDMTAQMNYMDVCMYKIIELYRFISIDNLQAV